MKMHGIHKLDYASCFEGKSNNEIIVLLEEIFQREKLNRKINELMKTKEQKEECL